METTMVANCLSPSIRQYTMAMLFDPIGLCPEKNTSTICCVETRELAASGLPMLHAGPGPMICELKLTLGDADHQ
jgi:hypothetical protein